MREGESLRRVWRDCPRGSGDRSQRPRSLTLSAGRPPAPAHRPHHHPSLHTMATKRKAGADEAAAADVPPPTDDARALAEILPLGAGQEVGRSCVIHKYQ